MRPRTPRQDCVRAEAPLYERRSVLAHYFLWRLIPPQPLERRVAQLRGPHRPFGELDLADQPRLLRGELAPIIQRSVSSGRSGKDLMSSEVTRRQMERWLFANGFMLKAGKKTSHRQFQGHGVTITLPGHGPADLTKKHVGMIMRKLEQAGFERAAVLAFFRGTAEA